MEEKCFISSSSHKRVAVVTGGNKGIGLEICRQLASNGITVILTARDEFRGANAVEELKESGLTDVIFHRLDVKDQSSISSLAHFVEISFNKLDILVNNAAEIGIIIHTDAFKSFKDGAGFMEVNDENAGLLSGIIEEPYEMAVKCIETNYYGMKRVSEALLPLLQRSNSPRIVNVSSYFGQLSWIPSEDIKSKLRNLDNLTEEKLDEILQHFIHDFKNDKLKANGWPLTCSAYKISKASMNAYTRLMAKTFPNILVNCVHPGYVVTDMTCNTGHLSPEEGAKAPVMLALLPHGSHSGAYFDQMVLSTF